MDAPFEQEMREAVRVALAEDVGSGDVTTSATIPAEAVGQAEMLAREPLIVAGLEFAAETFRQLSDRIEVERLRRDGEPADADEVVLRLDGPLRAILTGERVALNFVQRLSGVATLTARFVEAVRGTKAQIMDTRKTTPGWRRFEKYAVVRGGGRNHRFGLFDQVLIKDNHLAALADTAPNAIAAAVQRSRAACPGMIVEVEADTLEQVEQAVAAGADVVLLDNMGFEDLVKAVVRVGGRARTEASGGVNLETVRRIAEAGVDFISVGALTHSARAMDLALEVASGPSGFKTR